LQSQFSFFFKPSSYVVIAPILFTLSLKRLFQNDINERSILVICITILLIPSIYWLTYQSYFELNSLKDKINFTPAFLDRKFFKLAAHIGIEENSIPLLPVVFIKYFMVASPFAYAIPWLVRNYHKSIHITNIRAMIYLPALIIGIAPAIFLDSPGKETNLGWLSATAIILVSPYLLSKSFSMEKHALYLTYFIFVWQIASGIQHILYLHLKY